MDLKVFIFVFKSNSLKCLKLHELFNAVNKDVKKLAIGVVCTLLEIIYLSIIFIEIISENIKFFCYM